MAENINPKQKYLSELYTKEKNNLELYIDLLSKIREAIDTNKIEKLGEYTNIEETMMAGIVSVKLSIDSIEDQGIGTTNPTDIKILELKAQVGILKDKALALSKENRYIIEMKMAIIQEDLKTIRSKTGSKSPFNKIGNPQIIDISR
jgi:hypothetical protein